MPKPISNIDYKLNSEPAENIEIKKIVGVFNGRSITKTSSQPKLHVCPYDDCDKAFINAYLLKRHLGCRHSDERHYKCITCDKAFKSKDILTAHKKIHDNQKLYRCTACNAGFNQYVGLWKHNYSTIHKKAMARQNKCESDNNLKRLQASDAYEAQLVISESSPEKIARLTSNISENTNLENVEIQSNPSCSGKLVGATHPINTAKIVEPSLEEITEYRDNNNSDNNDTQDQPLDLSIKPKTTNSNQPKKIINLKERGLETYQQEGAKGDSLAYTKEDLEVAYILVNL